MPILDVLPQTNQKIKNPIRKDYTYPSVFFTVQLIKKQVYWIGTMLYTNTNQGLRKAESKKLIKSIYPSFFMNIKTIPSKKTIWIKQREVSDGWIEQPDMP